MEKNKITYGFKNVKYAKITETENEDGTIKVNYAAPVALPGGASVNLSKTSEKTAIAADDDPEYATAYDNKGYDGDIVLYDVPDSFLTDCLGMKVEADGTVVENADDKPSPFALLFEISGDKKKKRHVFYRCTATHPSVATTTKGNGLTANQATLTISAASAKDTKDIKRTCTESENEVYTKWFDSVPLSGGTATTEATTTEE